MRVYVEVSIFEINHIEVKKFPEFLRKIFENNTSAK